MKLKKYFLIILSLLFLQINFQLFPQTAVELYNLGKNEYFNENYINAINYFKQSIEKNPNYIEPIFELAKIYYELENYEYAYTFIKKALQLSPNNTDLILFSSDIELKLKMYDIAEKKYNAILKENPLNIKAYNGLSNLYFETNKKILAKKTLDNVLKSDPNNFDALNLTAKYFEQFDIRTSESYYLQNIEKNSLNPDSYFYYSIYNFNNNNIVGAINNIKKAIAIKNKLIYLKYYGKYLLNLEQGDESLNVFRQILTKSTEYIDYYDISLAYNLLSDFDSSINSLKKVINLRNDDEIASYLLNNILINNYPTDNENRKKRSYYFYSEALKAKKDGIYNLYLYLLKEAINLYPKNIEAREELADHFLILNFPERYIKELEVAAKYSDKTSLHDKLDIERKRISYRLGDDWDINQYHVNYDLFIMPLFIVKNIKNQHEDCEKTISQMIKNLFSNNSKFDIILFTDKNYTSDQKSEIAKSNNSQFFLELYAVEESNNISIKFRLLNANNFTVIKEYMTTKNGNNKVLLSLSSLADQLNNDIMFRAHILKLSKNKALINAGRNKNIKLKDEFLILRKKNYLIEFGKASYIYDANDIKGKAIAVKVDENIAELRLESNEFYNDIDIDDIVIYKK